MAAPYSRYGMMAAIWGYQAEAGLHAMRLILSGTFDRYPGLTFVLGHLGEGIPYWLRRIDNRHAFAQRVLAGAMTAIPKLELTPSEYFRRNFALTTSGMDDPDVLTMALRAVGDDNIMLAIDHLYEPSDEAVAFLRNAQITDTQRANIAIARLSVSSRLTELDAVAHLESDRGPAPACPAVYERAKDRACAYRAARCLLAQAATVRSFV